MSVKIGSSNIGDVYVGNNKISKIYVGSDLVHSAVSYQNDNRFVYSGIDSAGKYEFEYEYNGTAVSYGIGTGEDKYSYYHYTQIETPTTAEGYNGYYVKSGTTYTEVTYDSSNGELSPSTIIVGETPAYDMTIETFNHPVTDEAYVLYIHDLDFPYDNGLNPEYFTGVSISTEYSEKSDVPDIGINTLILPDTYNGKPVTKILDYALYGYFQPSSDSQSSPRYYLCCKIANLTFGANIKSVGKYACNNVCVTGVAASTCTLTLNDILQEVDEYSFGNVTFLDKKVVFPSGASSVTVHSLAFGTDACNKIIFSNPTVKLTVTNATYCLGDTTDWLVFQSTVTTINTAYFRKSTGKKAASLVFKQTSGVPFSDLSSLKSAISVTIYTDNQDIRNYDWASKNYTVTFKTLSEYPGD